MVLIEAAGLVKRYGEVTALDGLDLEVAKGSVLGLLGPNGAGKTTAVSILATLVEPDAGTARVAGADVVARGPAGERSVPIASFVQDMFTNSLAPDEMVVEVRVPVPPGRSGGSYVKLERKIGDYATVAVAAHLELGADGRIAAAGVALTSVAPINLKVTEAEALLVGSQPGPELFAEAAELAAAAADPRDDVRGTARWKRQVVRAFTRRALASAADQALKG